jgi:hypothetical protein
VRCAEDQAIDRLKALLLRECSERQRDGLDVHDEKRAERSKAIYATDLAFLRRDSASTSNSSDSCGQWEEESTRSAIDSQENQDLAPIQSVKIFPVQLRLVIREIWSNAFGIANDFRKEITGWLLEVRWIGAFSCKSHFTLRDSQKNQCYGLGLNVTTVLISTINL